MLLKCNLFIQVVFAATNIFSKNFIGSVLYTIAYSQRTLPMFFRYIMIHIHALLKIGMRGLNHVYTFFIALCTSMCTHTTSLKPLYCNKERCTYNKGELIGV